MIPKLTRRELAAAAVALAQVKPAKSQTIDDPALDPVRWTRMRYDSAPLKLTFRPGSKRDAEGWQKKLRPKIAELVGGFPETRTPLEPQTLGTEETPKFRRERVLFESRPGVKVSAYVLTPLSGKAPFATMVWVPGHGVGADDIIGNNPSGYQHDFAAQAVAHGMAAVAIEPMAFGCRRDAITMKKGKSTSACQPAAGAALLFGETMIGWRVYDVMRTIDWIATRKDLDVDRVGCMGISGGGTCTVFSAALEPRIRAAFVSGYLNTFRDSVLSLSHCIDNYVPGILNWAEMYDIAGLIAPRPLFVESGTRDPIFPITASKESFSRVKKVYEILGADDRIGQEIFDDIHTFSGVQGLPFMARALKV